MATTDNGPSRPLTAEEHERIAAKFRAVDEAVFEPRRPVEYWDFPDRLRGHLSQRAAT